MDRPIVEALLVDGCLAMFWKSAMPSAKLFSMVWTMVLREPPLGGLLDCDSVCSWVFAELSWLTIWVLVVWRELTAALFASRLVVGAAKAVLARRATMEVVKRILRVIDV